MTAVLPLGQVPSDDDPGTQTLPLYYAEALTEVTGSSGATIPGPTLPSVTLAPQEAIALMFTVDAWLTGAGRTLRVNTLGLEIFRSLHTQSSYRTYGLDRRYGHPSTDLQWTGWLIVRNTTTDLTTLSGSTSVVVSSVTGYGVKNQRIWMGRL